MKNLEKFKENNSSKSKDLTNASAKADDLKTVKERKFHGRILAKLSSERSNEVVQKYLNNRFFTRFERKKRARVVLKQN